MLPLMYYAFLKTRDPWLRRYRGWIAMAAAIWIGVIISFLANGPWLQSREFQAAEVVCVIKYLYWLLVFLVTLYLASDSFVQQRLACILGMGVIVLACLRGFEGLALGKVGAWTQTIFTSQNSYGVLFSAFAPFLFPAFLGGCLLRRAFAALGLALVLWASAINGSRGSWVCIAVGLAVFCVLAFVSRPTRSLRVIPSVGFGAFAFVAVLMVSDGAREAVLSRFSTFNDLDADKSYMTRQVMNQRSLKLFQISPSFGVGPARYKEVYVPLEIPAVLAGHSDADFMKRSAHNSYLSFLAECGVVGSIPLAVLFIILLARGAFAAATLNRRGEYWALAVYASFVSMSIHFWILSGLTNTATWFLYGLVAATLRLASQSRKKVPLRAAQVSLRRFTIDPRRSGYQSRPAFSQ
jgi:O-antigen ligase